MAAHKPSIPPESPSRRQFMGASMAAGATLLLPGALPAVPEVNPMKKTFTILHTNDMHSSLVGMGPASDYSPFTLNNDHTQGGFSRLASLIAIRKAAREAQGPVLVLDAGDYSMGTAFGAASRETGGELRLMGMMGYDAVTFGNHDFDLGAEGLGQSITVASRAGRVPTVVASNTQFPGSDKSLADLQRLASEKVIRRYLVIERGGTRFGLFGVLGKEAIFYTNPSTVVFSDAVAAAQEMVTVLRDKEKVDVVIALSHGGVEKDKDGRYHDGDDVRLAAAVPGIDVVIGGHSHTALKEAILAGGRTPVVQAGFESKDLGELVLTLEGAKLTVESYRLYPVDDAVLGVHPVQEAIDKLKPEVTRAVFASRGYSIDQPLAIAPRDLPNTFTDIAAGTPLANLVTDAFRAATKADVGFTSNGLMRAGLKRGKSGVQTVYDVFSVAPLGAGIVDTTAGSTLVTGYFNGLELKSLLEFLLVDHPAHPGEDYPRVSGMRFRYDPARPALDRVTGIELGDLDRGYGAIDITGKDERLYSLTCPLYLGLILAGIPKYTKGKLPLVPKNKDGQPLNSRVEALEMPGANTPYMLPPHGVQDRSSIATQPEGNAITEIKEWQAIMDYLRRLPVKAGASLPEIPVDERATEVRAIKPG